MEPAPSPRPPSEPPAGGTTAGRAHGLPPAAERRDWFERLEGGLAASNRWLRLVQDGILVAVAVVMLFMGILVLVTGVGELIGTITLYVSGGAVAVEAASGASVIDVAENALLALILAELVGTLLLSLRGNSIAIEPFIAIAVVAVVRHLLFAIVGPVGDHVTHTIELLGQGGLILLLVGAVALLRRRPRAG
jgi:uncharacterized membrane protein (DUF373 family)